MSKAIDMLMLTIYINVGYAFVCYFGFFGSFGSFSLLDIISRTAIGTLLTGLITVGIVNKFLGGNPVSIAFFGGYMLFWASSTAIFTTTFLPSGIGIGVSTVLVVLINAVGLILGLSSALQYATQMPGGAMT